MRALLVCVLVCTAAATALRINAGGPSVQSGGQYWRAERPDELYGVTAEFAITPDSEIALSEFDAVYRTQRFGTVRDSGDPIWGYNIKLQPGVYSLTLHFAEIYDGIFQFGEGPRVFHLAVGDNSRGYQAVQRDLNIYGQLRNQENSALTKTFTNLLVSDLLLIRFFPVSETPVINAISAERISALPASIFRVQVNCGGDASGTFVADKNNWVSSPYTDTTEIQDEDIRYRLYTDIDGELHIKQRFTYEKTLSYDAPVPNLGEFDVMLWFAENYVNGTGKRVFDIAVGDKNEMDDAQRVTGYDIFKAAKRKMYTPVMRKFSGIVAPSGFLRIELTSVIENALISAFVIERPGQEVFISTSNPVFNSESGGYDHQSHAVAGADVLAVDFNKDGFAVAELDSSLSHSHFFEPGPPSVSGKILQQTWYVDATNKTLGTGEQLVAPFPVGNTVVRLEVRDNTGDTHVDKVTVIALDRQVGGVYGYFYDSHIVTRVLHANSGDFTKDVVLPQFGQHIKTMEFVELKDYTWFSFMDLEFQARFLCNITVEKPALYVFSIEHLQSSPVKIFVDGGYLRLTLTGETSHESQRYLKRGKHLVEVIFRRFVTKSVFDAMLKVIYYPAGNKQHAMLLGETSATYDASAVQPTVHYVMPAASQLNGGGRVKVYGSGFAVSEPLKDGIMLTIRNSTVTDDDGDDNDDVDVTIDLSRPDAILSGPDLRSVTSWTMEFTAPQHDRNESLLLSVKTNAGVSNSVLLAYSETAAQPVLFREEKLLEKNSDKAFELARPTSVALGPDMRLYVGTMEGFVIRLTVDIFSLQVRHKCQSSAPGPNRVVLGVAFNPYHTNHTDPQLYVSTSTLFWKSRGDVGWANGKVQLMKSNVGGFCLGVVKDVVTGLPVSNYDHGVNGMTFDNVGNLYIAIGSSTNAGVSKIDDALGGVPDSPLSASIVVARLSKPGYNGHVRYDQYHSPGIARQISGDVDVYSSGLRNSYDLVMHSSGEIYATSNSANFGFGSVSTSCDTETIEREDGYADQIIHASQDSYHGHPNRNRGRFDKRQCVFYSAETYPGGVEGVFRKPLALVESSTDGIIEYTANTFDFQLRGDLFASKFAVGTSGQLYRMKMNATTGAVEFRTAEEFFGASGLSLVMLPNGAFAMPQIVQGEVLILSPEEVVPKGPYVTSVFPTRGPLRGGYRVIITGYNFLKPDFISVLFDGIEAEDVEMLNDHGRMLSCTIPSGKVAGHITVQVRTKDGLSPTLGKDFEYIVQGKET